ncbi:MAG TPA: hypothetical protein VK841_13800 [Polyangiaceae bacterium]|nr:hypothetical protein [Polyangiaceae bacterium]
MSPTSPLAKIALGVARELLRISPLERLVVDDGDTTTGFSIRRPDGKTVAIRSVAASKGGANLRGVDVVTLVLDESEFFASDEAALTDSDQIGAAIGPSMFMRPTPELALDIERETLRDPIETSRSTRHAGVSEPSLMSEASFSSAPLSNAHRDAASCRPALATIVLGAGPTVPPADFASSPRLCDTNSSAASLYSLNDASSAIFFRPTESMRRTRRAFVRPPF